MIQVSDDLEAKAKAAALASLNEARDDKGLTRLKQVPRLWWKLYRQEWINKTDQENSNER